MTRRKENEPAGKKPAKRPAREKSTAAAGSGRNSASGREDASGRKPAPGRAATRGDDNPPVEAPPGPAPVPPDAFAVSAGVSAVALGPERVGYVQCAISNTAGQAVRGLVRLRARPPEVLDWLTIQEEAERDYGPGERCEYTVRIEAPPQAPVGKYAFRMVAMSTEEPERVCSEGPIVSIVIAQPRFIRLLPGVFQRGAPSGSPLFALLLVMEQMYIPGERLLDALDDTFNAYRTPDSFVPYLASWVDLDRLLVEHPGDYQTGTLPPFPTGLGRLRDLIARSAELSRWRGTARGLTHFLETATGVEGVRIEETPAGPENQPLPFHMIIHVPAAAEQYRGLVERIVRMEKPAYMTYQILFE